MPWDPHLWVPPSPRLLGWRKDKSCDIALVWVSAVAVCSHLSSASLLEEWAQQSWGMKCINKGWRRSLQKVHLSTASAWAALHVPQRRSMSTAWVWQKDFFCFPSLHWLWGKKKIKFEGKRHIFWVVTYFKCSILLPVLNNAFVHKARTFSLPRRELRHFNLQIVLGIWFCLCTQKHEWNELWASRRSHGTSARDICYAFPVLSDPGWHTHSPTLKILNWVRFLLSMFSVHCYGLLPGAWFALGWLNWAASQSEPLKKCTRFGHLC